MPLLALAMLPVLPPMLPELPAPLMEPEPLMLPLLPAALEPVVVPALLVPPTAPLLVLVAGDAVLPDDAPVPLPRSFPMLLPEPSRPVSRALPSFDF
jgi:hypothetical protein